MARDISKRISRLQSRRTGMDRYMALDEAARVEVLAKSMAQERWQKRASADKSYTRYALGAMQEVGADQTRISLDTAERVGRQLEQGFAAKGRSVEFRLQGSVPLNVHIRRYSDVDLLFADIDTSLQHDEGNDKPFIRYSCQKDSEKHRKKKQRNSAHTAFKKNSGLRQRKRTKH